MDMFYRFFYPKAYQIVVYSVLSLTWLFTASLDAIATRLLPQYDLPLAAVAGQTLGSFLDFLATFEFMNTLVPAAFWVGVALIANFLVWTVKNVWIDTENQYIVEKHYINKGILAHRYHFIFRQLAWAAILVAAITASAQFLLPLGVAWFRGAWVEPSVTSIILAVAALGISVLNLHVLWGLTKATFSVE